MPRMIFAGMLALGLGFVLGCGGSKPPPEQAPAGSPEGNTGEPKPGEPTPKPDGNPKVDPPPARAEYELDPEKHAVPPGPVTGTLSGTPFTPGAFIDGESLVFHTAKDAPGGERRLALKFGPTGPLENRKVVVRPTDPAGPAVPEVWIERADRPGAPEVFRNGVALTLTLGGRKGGKVPGTVYLCLPDGEKSVFAGAFTADSPRQPTEPPGPDEVPYVQGAVAVRGAPPETRLVVGYMGNPNPKLFCFGQSQVTLAPLVAGNPRTVRDVTHENPKVVTSIVGGDGASVPGRFDHVNLPPGRYLVYATLAGGGPVAWKWVDVGPNSALTVDLPIDANMTGGVEVVVPPTILGKVQLIPAGEPNAPVVEPPLAAAIALQLGLEGDVVARKALFKNLGPGKYEVRAGGESRVVEVVAGKTAELDFDKKPAPPKPEPAPEPKPKG